mmetsp:Transcript_27443/g.88230  ORF Transcript_27443/g.88230 Transcript_27443/m.88230 type:complete len:485 (-) Transcript_27443:9-1463(-)
MLDCREAVCNGDRRPLVLRHDAVQRRLHHPLPGRIQRRRRLVQQQHRRLANDGASNRHPLLLAARKHASAEAHLRAVAVGEAVHHKAVRVRRPRRLLDLVLRGALLAVANVLGDGALEEHRLLPHQPKLGAEPAQVERADVDTVEGDRAALRVIEALEQRDESRLAAAGRAAQRHRLPRADREGVAVANGEVGAGGGRKDDVDNLDCAGDAEESFALVAGRVEQRGAVDALEVGDGGLPGLAGVRRLRRRPADARRHQEHHHQRNEDGVASRQVQRPRALVRVRGRLGRAGQRRVALADAPHAELEDGAENHDDEPLSEARHEGDRPVAPHGLPRGRLHDGAVLGEQLVLRCEGSDRPDAEDDLTDEGARRAARRRPPASPLRLFVANLVFVANFAARQEGDLERHGHAHQRQRAEDDQRDRPVAQRKHEREADQQCEAELQQQAELLAAQRLDESDRLAQELRQLARRVCLLVEEGNLHRQPL